MIFVTFQLRCHSRFLVTHRLLTTVYLVGFFNVDAVLVVVEQWALVHHDRDHQHISTWRVGEGGGGVFVLCFAISSQFKIYLLSPFSFTAMNCLASHLSRLADTRKLFNVSSFIQKFLKYFLLNLLTFFFSYATSKFVRVFKLLYWTQEAVLSYALYSFLSSSSANKVDLFSLSNTTFSFR